MNLSKTLLVLPVLSLFGAAALAAGACSSSATFTLPTGAADVTTTFGTCDDEGGYAVVTDDSLCAGSVTCTGDDYYAICDGTVFSACTCGVPDTGTVITDPVFTGGGDAGDDADTTSTDDAGDDADTTSTDDASATDDGGTTTDDAGANADDSGTSTDDAGATTTDDASAASGDAG